LYFSFACAQHIQIKYYLYYFEVQNLADTMKGQRPILTQLGPYAYDEYYVKFDIEWTDDGDTVTYYTQKYYLFNKDETLPGLSEHDNITLPYVTAIGFEYLLNTIPVEADVLLDAALDVRASFCGFNICAF
jgi:hypothetical protein